MSNDSKKIYLEEVKYVKTISVGSLNPNNPISDEGIAQQVSILNKCLNDYPRGIIIGKDITIGRYMIGPHELTMERTTYHIGFKRKPVWIEEE